MEQSAIAALVESRSKAIRTKNLDRLMSYYASSIIYFDVVPPLQYVGSVALRNRFSNWFEGYESGIEQEVRDLHIWVSGDAAIAAMLIRSGGTLKNGKEIGLWVRASNGFQWSDGEWLITHEHISVPVDLRSGSAVTDIEP